MPIMLMAQNLSWSNWMSGYGYLSLKSDRLLYYPRDYNNSPFFIPQNAVAYADSVSGNIKIIATAKAIYNGDFQPVLNGMGLISCDDEVCMVPFPSGENKYYVFHSFVQTTSSLGLQTRCGVLSQINGVSGSFTFYSIVDMDANNGQGEVIEKNKILTSIGSSDFLLIRHANGRDVWLLINGSPNTKIFLIDPTGIHTYPPGNLPRMILCDADPNGKTFAGLVRGDTEFSLTNEIEVVNFDNATGKMTHNKKFTTPVKPKTLTYSPDGTKIYVTGNEYVHCLYKNYLYQYDLSETKDEKALYTVANVGIGGMVRAFDKTIYVEGEGATNNQQEYIIKFHRIQQPNLPKAGCMFTEMVYESPSSIFFPPIINDYVKEVPNTPINDLGLLPKVVLCNGSITLSAASGYNNYIWSNGFTGKNLVVSEPGMYRVLAYESGNPTPVAQGFTEVVYGGKPLNLPNDTMICIKKSFQINVGKEFSQVAWSDGTVGNQYTFTVPPNRQKVLIATARDADNCYTTDTICVTFVDPPRINLGNDTTICQGQTAKLLPDPYAYFSPPGLYSWSNGTSNYFLNVNETGTYWCSATQYGCTSVDTVQVKVLTKNDIYLGRDTALCQGDSLLLKPNYQQCNYWWNANTIAQQLNVKNTGTYIVQPKIDGCTISDTIGVLFGEKFTIQLPSDTSVCFGNLIVLSPRIPGSINNWNGAFDRDSLYVNAGGTIDLTVTRDGCVQKKAINVQLLQLPTVNIGRDTLLCNQTFLKIEPKVQDAVKYNWNTGATTPTINAIVNGYYELVITGKNGCENKAGKQIRFLNTPVIKLRSDTTICNGESITLQNLLPGNYQYVWQDGSTNETFLATKWGNYALQAINECGIGMANVTLKEGICSLLMPNAFTPNNDGLNDVFRLKNHQFVANFQLMVFDRQKRKLFETSDVTQGWDGTYQGKLVEPGTYLWYIKLTDKTGQLQTHSGTVVVLTN